MSIVDNKTTGVWMISIVRTDVMNHIRGDVSFPISPDTAIGAWTAHPVCCDSILCLPRCDGINTILVILGWLRTNKVPSQVSFLMLGCRIPYPLCSCASKCAIAPVTDGDRIPRISVFFCFQSTE